MPQVTFKITGDVKQAIGSLKSFRQELDKIASHQGMRNVASNMSQLQAGLRAATSAAQQMNAALRNVQQSQVRITNNLRDQRRTYNRINQSSQVTVRNTINMGRAFRQARTEATGLHRTVQNIGTGLAMVAKGVGQAINRAVSGLQGSIGSGLGGVQSTGIGMRMSGIALGNQLAQIMGGPVAGNVLSSLIGGLRTAINQSAGLVSIGTQLATRIVTGIGGTIVKMIGPIVGGLTNALVGGIGAGLALATTGITKFLGVIGFQAANALQGLASGITQFAGEIVIQVGNIFTGITEVVRGAFQAAVNVATGLLNSLLSVAQGVAERIAGAFGKIAGTLGAVGSTLAGLALRDRVRTDKEASSAALLFNNDVSSARRGRFKEGVQRLGFQFPTLDPRQIAKAAEMVVSTGFQHSPEDALEFLRGILPLAEIANLREIPELARAAAKVKDLFADEVQAKAGGGARDQGAFIAGRLSQVRNIGDLEIRDMSLRLGEAAGVGKVFGQTLDEILQQLALISRGLNPEETFTAFRSLVSRLQKPAKQTREMFDAVGIRLKKLTPEQEKQVKLLEKQRDAAKSVKDAKAKQAEIDKILVKAESRKALDIVRQAAEMRRAGQLSGEQFATLFPNLRGLKGAAAEAVLGQGVAQQVQEIFAQNPADSLAAKQDSKRNSLSFGLADAFKGAKEPFDAFFAAVESQLMKFLKDTRSTFGRVTEFVRNAFNDPGAAQFASQLGDVLAPAMAPIVAGFERLMAMQPGEFWAAMSDGLSAVVEFADRTITFFTTLAELIARIVGSVPGITSFWDAIKGAAEAVGQIVGDLSKGDSSSLEGLFAGIGESIQNLINSTREGFASLMSQLGDMVDKTGTMLTTKIQEIVTQITSIGAGLFAAGGVGMAMRGAGAARASQAASAGQLLLAQQIAARGGAGASPATAAATNVIRGGGVAGIPGMGVPLPGQPSGTSIHARGATPWIMGQGGRLTGGPATGMQRAMGGLGRGAMGLGRALGPLMAMMGAFSLTSDVAQGGNPDQGTGLGGALGTTLTGTGTGAAIGSVVPVIGTAIGAVVGTLIGAAVAGLNAGAAEGEQQAQADAQAKAKRLADAQSRLRLADMGKLSVRNEDGTLGFKDAASGARGQFELARQRFHAQQDINRENGGGNVFQQVALAEFEAAMTRAMKAAQAEDSAKFASERAAKDFAKDSGFGSEASFLETVKKALALAGKQGKDGPLGFTAQEASELEAAANLLKEAVSKFGSEANQGAAMKQLLKEQSGINDLIRSHNQEDRDLQHKQAMSAADSAMLQAQIRDILLDLKMGGITGATTADAAAVQKAGKGRTTLSDGTVVENGEVVVRGADVKAQKEAMLKKVKEQQAAAKQKAAEAQDPMNPNNPDFKKNVLLKKAQMKKDAQAKAAAANAEHKAAVEAARPVNSRGFRTGGVRAGGQTVSGFGFTRAADSMGRRVNRKDSRDVRPNMGGFGIISGRAMRNRRRDAEKGIFSDIAGNTIGDPAGSGATGDPADSQAGSPGKSKDGKSKLNAAAQKLDEVAKNETKTKEGIDKVAESIDGLTEANKTATQEMTTAVTAMGESMVAAVTELKSQVEDLKGEIESVKEQLASASAGGQ